VPQGQGHRNLPGERSEQIAAGLRSYPAGCGLVLRVFCAPCQSTCRPLPRMLPHVNKPRQLPMFPSAAAVMLVCHRGARTREGRASYYPGTSRVHQRHVVFDGHFGLLGHLGTSSIRAVFADMLASLQAILVDSVAACLIGINMTDRECLMHVLVCASRKGGGGKTVCARHLAVSALNAGLRVAVLDLDPMIGLTRWWNRRAEDALELLDLIPEGMARDTSDQRIAAAGAAASALATALPSLAKAGHDLLTRIIHEKCAVKAKPLISFTTMRMGCLMKFFAMKSLAQVFGGLGRFRAVR